LGEYELIENTSKVYYNGSEWNSKTCGKFIIIGKTNRYNINKRDNNKNYCYYLCEFKDGTIMESQYGHIRTGYVRNPNHRYVYNVGYVGKGKWSTINNGKITKEYVVWSEMIRRCYAPNAPKKFPAYIGITVCERWHCFQNFCEDIKYLKGYNEWKNNVGYELDKDILCSQMNISPKIYSLETCMFITHHKNVSESTSRKNLTGFTYIGISPDGIEYEFTNQLEFSKEHNLSNCLINECIHKTRNQHKGWTFKIKG